MEPLSLKCIACEQQLPNQTVPMYLFVCRDLACSLHMMSPTCTNHPESSVICEVSSDSICKSLCEIGDGIIKASPGVPQEYLWGMFCANTQAIGKRLRDIIQMVRLPENTAFQPCEPVGSPSVKKWKCEVCECENDIVNQGCWNCHERESYYSSVSMPIPRSRKQDELAFFSQITTIVQKDGFWWCIKCNGQNPCSQTMCNCGFVNLRLVSSGLPPSGPLEEMKETCLEELWTCPVCGAIEKAAMDTCNTCGHQNNPPQLLDECNPGNRVEPKPHTSPIWKCTNCPYEYNLNTSDKCLKCGQPNPLMQPKLAAQVVAAPVEPAILVQFPVTAPVKPVVREQAPASDVSPIPPRKRSGTTGVNGRGVENGGVAKSRNEGHSYLKRKIERKIERKMCSLCKSRPIATEELCQQCFDSKPPENKAMRKTCSLCKSRRIVTEELCQQCFDSKPPENKAMRKTCSLCKSRPIATEELCQQCFDSKSPENKEMPKMCSLCKSRPIVTEELCQQCVDSKPPENRAMRKSGKKSGTDKIIITPVKSKRS